MVCVAENQQKTCNMNLYVVTNPLKSFYVEVIDPIKTIVHRGYESYQNRFNSDIISKISELTPWEIKNY